MTYRNRKLSPLLAPPAAVLMVGALSLIAPQIASATPQYAKETGKSCGECHQDAKGGKALTPLGTAFQANGNKLPPTASKAPPKTLTP